MPSRLQADVLTVIWHVAFFSTLAFVVVVSRAWKWWRHQFGRALMSVNFLLTLAFLPGELALAFHVMLSAWVSIAVVAAIPLRTAWLATAIIRIPARDGEGEAAPRRRAAERSHQ